MTHPFPEPLPSDLTTDSIAAASSAAGTRSQARWTGDISGRDSEGGGDGHHLIGAGAGDLRRRSGGRCREEEIGQLAGHLLGVHRLAADSRSEEHTTELQSLMRSSYAVFCLK